jgi:hypothetical protein
MSIKRLVDKHEDFDQADWEVIETSPFLVWYLKVYYEITRPESAKAFSEDIDDLPF